MIRDGLGRFPPSAHSKAREAHGEGLAAFSADRLEQAAAHFQEAVDLDESVADHHHDLGRALFVLWRFVDAERAFRRALAIDPSHFDAGVFLGRVLDAMGMTDQAVDRFRQALGRRPDHAAVHLILAQSLLASGDFESGWEEYEWRHRNDAMAFPDIGAPQWNGQDLSGKTIVLFGEQGYGDTLQFIRYAPIVAARAAGVWLGCPSPLARLLNRFPGVDGFLHRGRQPIDADFYCPLASLPRALGTRLSSIPADIPYIEAAGAAARRWARRLADVRRPRIGLVWAGRPTHPNDIYRSLPPMTLLEHLYRRAGPRCGYVSLQTGDRAADAMAAGVGIHDAAPRLHDFADTAAAIANLDLVVSVDTAVAHLAGAMGKPVWLLLPYVADWRWLRDRQTSPWYPSMRLVRQPTPGGWTAVIETVAGDLANMVEK